jgi:hypothetical protein
MTVQQAAQQAIDVQDACNLSGVLNTFHTIVTDVLRPEAERLNKGSGWVATHPICTMFICKLECLNGDDNSLSKRNWQAFEECKQIASTEF